MTPGAGPYATMAAIARLFNTPVGTLQRWASEDQWARSSNRRRPVRYSYPDACTSWEKRRTEQGVLAP